VEKRWVVLNETGKDLREILIKNRDIRDPDSFFKPHLYKLTPPDKLFSDLERAVERIKRAIKNKELVYIYGDFDVDGITATAILWETIHFLGGKVLPYIPHREKEGYGIHADVLETLAGQGAKVIVSVDCGITAVEEAEIARKLGVDLIITDHHLIQKTIPKPFALLHCDKLAGAGVAFMLAKALLEAFHKKDDEQLYANLGLAGIGTIADMVPLTGDNRIITANGLHNLSSTDRIGLQSLYNEAAITKSVGTYEVGFIIAPRLNAAGRLEHAMDSLRLLLTKKKQRAREIATKLSETNKKRQEATISALSHARELISGNGASKILIAHHPTYQQGVVGLVAGRLVDENYKPAVVISEMSPISKGSARSVSGFNITDAIKSASKYLESAGGHPMAAGFSIEPAKIPKFKEKLSDYAEKNLDKEDLTPTLRIDTQLGNGSINYKTLEILRQFEPFGIGNPEPVFLTKNLQVKDVRRLGREGKHLRMVLRSPENFIYDAIGFGMGGANVKIGDRIDTVYNIRENNWQGNKKLELKLKDFRHTEKN